MPRTVNQIIKDVASAAMLDEWGIRDLTNRTYIISLARHVVFYVAKKETKLSFKKLAHAFGSDDHKLALYGFNRISILVRDKDQAVIGLIEEAGGSIA